MDHPDIFKHLKPDHYRVAIFGSARVKKDDQKYQQIYQLAQHLGKHGIDVVTGGGPGLMEAASAGHQSARSDADAIGLNIYLPFEQQANIHLDVEEEFHHFSSRLDHFMILSNAVVVAPGGVGTILELFYTWQLMQVKHICNMPIILLGDMWEGLLEWLKLHPMHDNLFDEKDLNLLYWARTVEEAAEIIDDAYKHFQEQGDEFCLNYKKYKLV